ncbi:glycosyltransferase [Kordia sp.]|uniref:glycosyltransferase n=1 Tax=Kordia sp. TaxID=1965332 RepID=UPI003D2AD194
MHILKIIHGFPPLYNAGSEVYSEAITKELSKKYRVTVFTREENVYRPDFEIRQEKRNQNLVIYYINNPQSKDGYKHSAIDEIFENLIQDLQPDISHVGHLNHLSTGIIDVLYKHSIPIVFTLHDFWLMCPRGQFLTRSIGQENNYQVCNKQDHTKCASDCYRVYFSGKKEEEEIDMDQWTHWIERRMNETKSIIDKVSTFIAPANYLRNRFINDFNIPSNKIQYLDYGFDTSYLKPDENNTERPFTFGYIGTHIPAKGINLLIEAFKKIEKSAQLLIYGRDRGQSTKALRLLASSSKNKIEFLPEYKNENIVREVFSKVDCIVVPSIWAENSPLVIHEAQACHIPVITANYGGMKEYVHHKLNGLLFEHRNHEDLYVKMLYAINNPNEMKVLGKQGYLYSEDGKVVSIDTHCEILEDIYKSQLDTKLWRITIDTNPEDCNLSCIMCEEHSPYSNFISNLYKTTGIKRRRMNFEMVTSILEQAKGLGIKEIIPSTMGEPLLYKEFDALLKLASSKELKINLTTNGTFPKKSVLEWAKLIVPITTDVKISWNGATSTTASTVMKGIDFDTTIENVKTFIAYRDSFHEKTGTYCRVTFQLTFMQNNMHELSDIIKLAASLGVDRVKGHQLWAHFDEIKHLSMQYSDQSISTWNTYVSEAHHTVNTYLKPNGEKVVLENITPLTIHKEKQVTTTYECPFLDKELWISATGKISPCCAPDELRQSLGDFGNIKETSIAEVVKSEQYRNLVKNYKSNALCQSCNMRKPC